MVAERATVFQGVQLGVESTPGTGVPANKQLNSLSIEPGIALTIDAFRPMGNKFATVTASGKDWTQSRYTGKGTYTEIAYILSSLFGAASISAPDAQNAYTWTFSPASISADAFKAYTVEQGSSVRAQKFTHGLFASLAIAFDRDRVDISGNMIGQALQDGISLSGSPTALALVPILGKEITVYADTTSGGLGGTKLGRLLRGTFSFGQNKYNPLWVVDAAQGSFVSVVEAAPQATFETLLEADAAGMAFLANARAGDTRFIRIQMTSGTAIGTTAGTPPTSTYYSLSFDMAAKIGTVGAYQDQDAVYAIPLTWSLVHDGGWGKALTCSLVTSLSGL